MTENIDRRTVAGFADEWTRFDQSDLAAEESLAHFQNYFALFPWHDLPPDAVGFDLGCGSGRWARHVAPRVGRLHCIDASPEVIAVAQRHLLGLDNCRFHTATVSAIPLADRSMDFGYCLGVLHHVPDTLRGIQSCVSKLRPGAPFLLYLYYAFDNRPKWFQAVWKVSDVIRRFVSKCPSSVRYSLSQIIAAFIYFPLSRLALVFDAMGCDVASFPLSFYRRCSFYTMRTDALDRFGTILEKRFSAAQVEAMMAAAGLERIAFNDTAPFWCALGYRRY